MINETVKAFMAYWDQRDKNGDGKESGDQIRVLAEAFRRVRAEFDAARKDVLSYAVPKRGPHGIGIAFSAFHTEEVSELTNRIENLEDQQQDIEKDIVEAVGLCDGYSYKVLERHARSASQGISGGNVMARQELKRQARRPENASLSMAELASLPQVARIEETAEMARKTEKGTALYYKERTLRMGQLISKWRAPSVSHLIKSPVEVPIKRGPAEVIHFGFDEQHSHFGYQSEGEALPDTDKPLSQV